MINLVPDGDRIIVSATNIDEYLVKLAEYMIKTRYEVLYENFKEGF